MTSCLMSSMCELWKDRPEMEFRDEPNRGEERRSGSCAGLVMTGSVFSGSAGASAAALAAFGLK